MCHMHEYEQTQPHEKIIPYDRPHKPLEVVGANKIPIKNKTLLCIVDYYSKFPVIKKRVDLLADNLIRSLKIVCKDFRLPKKICRHKFHVRDI